MLNAGLWVQRWDGRLKADGVDMRAKEMVQYGKLPGNDRLISGHSPSFLLVEIASGEFPPVRKPFIPLGVLGVMQGKCFLKGTCHQTPGCHSCSDLSPPPPCLFFSLVGSILFTIGGSTGEPRRSFVLLFS